MAPFSHCLTGESKGGLLNVLLSNCEVSQAFDPKVNTAHPTANTFTAIWDTGATNSVITQNVVDRCGLHPITMTMVTGVHGAEMAEVYLISLKLPNNVDFVPLRVTGGKFIGGDVLIGMDIINQGDFAVSNYSGLTVFTFRHPSEARIDFVQEAKHKAQQSFQHGGKKHKRPKRHKTYGKNKHR